MRTILRPPCGILRPLPDFCVRPADFSSALRTLRTPRVLRGLRAVRRRTMIFLFFFSDFFFRFFFLFRIFFFRFLFFQIFFQIFFCSPPISADSADSVGLRGTPRDSAESVGLQDSAEIHGVRGNPRSPRNLGVRRTRRAQGSNF